MTSSRAFNTSVALFLVAGVVSSTAHAQGRGRPDQKDRKDQKHEQPQQQRQDPRHASPQEQKQREDDQHRREAQYKPILDRQVIAAQQHAAQLQQQNRAAQAAQQQQYLANLREQQRRLQVARDYRSDPYFTAPRQYRYRLGGNARETNQQGADLLRQGVNYGYQQGYNAGRADKQDRQQSNYQRSYAYQDANYGYNGNYVPQSDYNYYFRQGFQRGYTDGYGNTTRYGTVSSGSESILGTVLTTILGLTSIR